MELSPNEAGNTRLNLASYCFAVVKSTQLFPVAKNFPKNQAQKAIDFAVQLTIQTGIKHYAIKVKC